MSFFRPARPRTGRIASLSLLLAACASESTRSVSDAEIVGASAHRATLADLESALELADLGPLDVPIPERPSELRPDQAEFWQASAFAWNPELRRARRALRESLALSRSAGRSGPIEVEYENFDFGGDDHELTATVDLLGLLGLGPSEAARKVARAETLAQYGELESRVWSTRFEVDRARVRVAAAKSRTISLAALLDHASEDLPRVQILSEHGWIGPTMELAAFQAIQTIDHHLSMARSDLARSQAELARACGLDASHPSLEEIQSGAVDRFRSAEVDWRDPNAEELLARLPRLRAKRLELALAEAELRSQARQRWPSLRLGPKLVWSSGDTNVGGMLGVEIPFPGALDGIIDAARERREAAREALEDELVAARTRITETRQLLKQAIEKADIHSAQVDLYVARMFEAAQTQFQIDPEALERWSIVLRDRVETLDDLANSRANAVLAFLDYEEARGVAPGVEDQP